MQKLRSDSGFLEDILDGFDCFARWGSGGWGGCCGIGPDSGGGGELDDGRHAAGEPGREVPATVLLPASDAAATEIDI